MQFPAALVVYIMQMVLDLRMLEYKSEQTSQELDKRLLVLPVSCPAPFLVQQN